MNLPDLPAGVYRHWKGPLYLVLGYAHDANNSDRLLVVYIPLELDEAHTGPRLAVRDVWDFTSSVHTDDGKICQVSDEGYLRGEQCDNTSLRFTYIGPSYEGPDV